MRCWPSWRAKGRPDPVAGDGGRPCSTIPCHESHAVQGVRPAGEPRVGGDRPAGARRRRGAHPRPGGRGQLPRPSDHRGQVPVQAGHAVRAGGGGRGRGRRGGWPRDAVRAQRPGHRDDALERLRRGGRRARGTLPGAARRHVLRDRGRLPHDLRHQLPRPRPAGPAAGRRDAARARRIGRRRHRRRRHRRLPRGPRHRVGRQRRQAARRRRALWRGRRRQLPDGPGVEGPRQGPDRQCRPQTSSTTR